MNCPCLLVLAFLTEVSQNRFTAVIITWQTGQAANRQISVSGKGPAKEPTGNPGKPVKCMAKHLEDTSENSSTRLAQQFHALLVLILSHSSDLEVVFCLFVFRLFVVLCFCKTYNCYFVYLRVLMLFVSLCLVYSPDLEVPLHVGVDAVHVLPRIEQRIEQSRGRAEQCRGRGRL